MREVNHHQLPDTLNARIKVEVGDVPKKDNPANYSYTFWIHNPSVGWTEYARLRFHKSGPVVYNDDGNPLPVQVNGITNEALLSVLIDRLEGYQKGPKACPENSSALTRLYEALHWLQERTKERQGRGVEGEQAK